MFVLYEKSLALNSPILQLPVWQEKSINELSSEGKNAGRIKHVDNFERSIAIDRCRLKFDTNQSTNIGFSILKFDVIDFNRQVSEYEKMYGRR